MADDPDAGSPVARHEHAVERRLGAEVLVVLGGRDEVHRLAGPAALVWEALLRPGTRDQVTDRLRSVAPEGVDVGAVVGTGLTALAQAGLVTGVEP